MQDMGYSCPYCAEYWKPRFAASGGDGCIRSHSGWVQGFRRIIVLSR